MKLSDYPLCFRRIGITGKVTQSIIEFLYKVIHSKSCRNIPATEKSC